MMEDQMKFAFMQQGGVLRDDGMNKDPVSGNEVPSGSMAKEVRDDIDAKLSEGEYVVPADVVRFHGVEKFEDLRNQAKQGFGRMEQDGRIGGEPVNEDFPIPMNQLQTFDEGGDTSTYEQTFGQPFQMGQRYGDMGGVTNRGYELVTYTSPDGKRTIVIPHFNGKPMSAIPTGFAEQGTQTTGGGGGVGTDDDSDRQEAENEAVQRRNMGQPVTVDPLMQAQIDKDRQLSQPKAIENFTGKDYADYYNQTQGFGIDDIAKNVPLLGGLLSMQDDNIRKSALKGLQDGTLDIGDSTQFNSIKKLITTAPQQGFLSRLFGVKQDFTPPTGLPETFADYQGMMQPKVDSMGMGGIDPNAKATSAQDLQYLDPKKALGTDEVDSIITNLGKDAVFKGSIADKMTKAMFGITDGNKINTPDGVKEATAGQLKGIIDNAQNIQTSLVGGKDPQTGEDKKSIIEDPQSYGIDKPIGSGPPSVQEMFNAIHGMDVYNTGGIVANKGALVTKPKRKIAPKKRTPRKGLGNKTKAT